jgi:hypothetical protein
MGGSATQISVFPRKTRKTHETFPNQAETFAIYTVYPISLAHTYAVTELVAVRCTYCRWIPVQSIRIPRCFRIARSLPIDIAQLKLRNIARHSCLHINSTGISGRKGNLSAAANELTAKTGVAD